MGLALPTLPILPIILLVGVIGTAAAVIARQSDTEFIFRQQNLTALAPATIEHFVASAPDPRPAMGGHRASRARCVAEGLGELRNPWVCTVTYPVGPDVRYIVTIDPTGHVNGASSDGSLVVYGCCVGPRPS